MKLKNLYRILLVLKDIYDLDTYFWLLCICVIFWPSHWLELTIGWLCYSNYIVWFDSEEQTDDNVRQLREAWYGETNETSNTK